MKIIEVLNKNEIKKFHKIPYLIYKNDKNWIPHIKQEIESVFDPKKNKFFDHGIVARFILFNSNKLIGRIAVFIDKKRSNTFEIPTGGIGFFECIEDESAAFKLFDTAKKWLEERKIKAMDGPINFGEKDRYWGLLINGFDHPPLYGHNYNPDYYKSFFIKYGFKTYFKQHTFIRPLVYELPKRFHKRFERIDQNKRYSLKKIDLKYIVKFAEDFRKVYNSAWVTHDNFKEMSSKQSISLLKKIKPVMDKDLIWFAYYDNDPIGFVIMLPELNQYFKVTNGNFNIWGKIKFFIKKILTKPKFVWGLAFGITPKFQGIGMESYILWTASQQIINHNKHYKECIISWIGDFNPKMIHITKSMGGKEYHEHLTLRKIFDNKIKFKRSPIIE